MAREILKTEIIDGQKLEYIDDGEDGFLQALLDGVKEAREKIKQQAKNKPAGKPVKKPKGG